MKISLAPVLTFAAALSCLAFCGTPAHADDPCSLQLICGLIYPEQGDTFVASTVDNSAHVPITSTTLSVTFISAQAWSGTLTWAMTIDGYQGTFGSGHGTPVHAAIDEEGGPTSSGGSLAVTWMGAGEQVGRTASLSNIHRFTVSTSYTGTARAKVTASYVGRTGAAPANIVDKTFTVSPS